MRTSATLARAWEKALWPAGSPAATPLPSTEPVSTPRLSRPGMERGMADWAIGP